MTAVAVERSLFVAAPISRIWEVVSAADEYHRYTATLAAKLSERAESVLESILESYRVVVDSAESSDGEECLA